jgi:hydroxymethylpyrimidine pyrophosphatase-like HAD family hydrolase
VNGWFGTYDKLTMTRRLMRESFGVDLDADRARYVFVGDSPNDAPMFEYFPNAVGVANVREFGALVGHMPAYVTAHACGAGFRELAEVLLAER